MLQETIGNIRTLRECGRLAEAIDLAARALAETPDDGRLWEEKGLLHDRFGEFHDAQDALERATTLVPLRPLARCVLAERYVELGCVRSPSTC